MNANFCKFSQLLNGDKHYIIPIFQRLYSWKSENCQKFFDDIKELIETEKEHFMGSIIEILHHKAWNGLTANMVIDGQQRFTTFTLFILALMHHSKTENQEEILHTYLVNQYKKDDEYYKILLIENDMEILKEIIAGNKLKDEHKNSIIYSNYEFFRNEISKNQYSLDDYRKALEKLTIVIIELDQNDNSQLIFESINSTGLDLSQADLIKNYILMGLMLDDQKQIYNKYWKRMEEDLIRVNQLDNFFKHFLTIKTKKPPKLENIYSEFKKYRKNHSEKSILEIVQEIHVYFEIFLEIISNKYEEKEIRTAMKSLLSLKLEVINPLLLELFKKYKKNSISVENLCSLIKIFSSYIVRRSFCALPTSTLNKTFISLIGNLESHNIHESILATILSFTNTQKFPTDVEFKENFVSRNFYAMKNKNTILQIIENYDNKTELEFSKYTVEHILPQGQEVPEYWQQALGEDWEDKFEKWVQTIGNITLTLYNSELSNKSFIDKKTMQGGFLESQLKLNKFVVKCSDWNEKQIQTRAEQLFEYCLKIWPRPFLDKDTIDKNTQAKKELNIEYQLSDHKFYKEPEIATLFNKIINFSKNINPNVSFIFLKEYIKIIDDNETIGFLIFNKNVIKFTFNKFDNLIDEQKNCRNLKNIGHCGIGDTEITINTENFDQISKILEQIIEESNN